MIRNLSLTLGKLVSSTAKAVLAQQRLLDSMAKILLDNHIVLDYLLAKQGSVCVIASTSCCTWINASGEVKTQ